MQDIRPLPWRTQAAIAFAFLAASCLLRLGVFKHSVLDWDESLYFIIAEQWRHGLLPYVAIWDNKPPGIYAIFVVFQMLFGDRVAAIRIATAIFAAVLAFAIFKIVLRIAGGQPGQIVCSLFAGFTSLLATLSNDGLSANTELFMAAFTCLAMLCALSPLPPWPRALITGLLYACALMIKYVTVFEAPALAFALLIYPAYPAWPGWRQAWQTIAGAIIGGAIPVLLVVLLYTATRQLPAWWADSIMSNFRRVNMPIAPGVLSTIISVEITRWLPLYLAALAILIQMPRHRTTILLGIWFIGGCIGVISAKSFYDHYFLQILPVMCVCLGTLCLQAARLNIWTPARALLAAVIILYLPARAGLAALQNASGPDVPRQIAAILIPALPPGTHNIYVFDDQPILYSLTRQTPPTSYVLPSILTKCSLAPVAQVDPVAEVTRILATNPLFIIRRSNPGNDPTNPDVYDLLNRTLTARYGLWRAAGGTLVYRLQNPRAAIPQGKARPSFCEQKAAKKLF